MLDDDGMLLTDCQQMIHSDAAGMDDDAELLRMTKNKKNFLSIIVIVPVTDSILVLQ